MQVGRAWVGAVPGDVARFEHHVEIEAVGHAEGLRWRGAAVHGPTNERFLYLAWTGLPQKGGPREMFRRAKLKLGTVPEAVLAKALAAGVLRAELPLRLADGTPVCATPKALVWSA